MSAKYFSEAPRQLHILSNSGAQVLGMLDMGLRDKSGQIGRVTVSTSKAGMSIMLNGRKMCSGKTADECIAKFKALQERATQTPQ